MPGPVHSQLNQNFQDWGPGVHTLYAVFQALSDSNLWSVWKQHHEGTLCRYRMFQWNTQLGLLLIILAL